jgi:hypothetical protein
MFSTNIQGNFRRFGMVFSLAFGFMMLSVINTQAQYRDPNYYPQRNQNDQYRREHRRDRRDNDDRDRNNGSYNRGNRDNDQRYERNRRSDNGYYGNNGYGNNIYRIAQQYGYQDGLNKGAEEAREGDRYNPQSTTPYKNATNGYDRNYGNREQYKQAYRQAFLQGFDQGYNQYRNRWNRNGNYNNRSRRGY